MLVVCLKLCVDTVVCRANCIAHNIVAKNCLLFVLVPQDLPLFAQQELPGLFIVFMLMYPEVFSLC